jgi:hypothetical protein
MKEIESGAAGRDSIPLSDIYPFCLKYIHESGDPAEYTQGSRKIFAIFRSV